MKSYNNEVDEFTIKQHLDDIEETCDVKILLAVEAGSRAMGMASVKSDWDVRFIYVESLDWYLSVDDKHDTIRHKFDDNVEVYGIELSKALKLYKKYNLSFRAWMNSPKIYRFDEFFRCVLQSIDDYGMGIEKLICHYNYNYNQHYERYLIQDSFSLKTFLHYLYGVLACRYIEIFKQQPPVSLKKLASDVIDDADILKSVYELIRVKTDEYSDDLFFIDRDVISYANNLSDYYNDYVKNMNPNMKYVPSERLDMLLYRMVMKNHEENERLFSEPIARKAKFICRRKDILNALKVVKPKSEDALIYFNSEFGDKIIWLSNGEISVDVPCRLLDSNSFDIDIRLRHEAFVQYCDITEDEEYTFEFNDNELQLNNTTIRFEH